MSHLSFSEGICETDSKKQKKKKFNHHFYIAPAKQQRDYKGGVG